MAVLPLNATLTASLNLAQSFDLSSGSRVHLLNLTSATVAWARPDAAAAIAGAECYAVAPTPAEPICVPISYNAAANTGTVNVISSGTPQIVFLPCTCIGVKK